MSWPNSSGIGVYGEGVCLATFPGRAQGCQELCLDQGVAIETTINHSKSRALRRDDKLSILSRSSFPSVASTRRRSGQISFQMATAILQA
jgi:hypothetical protein